MKDHKNCQCHTNAGTEFYPETNQPLIRPEVNIRRAALLLAAVIALDVLCSFGIMSVLSHFEWYSNLELGAGFRFFIIFAIVCLASILIFSKRIVIFAIRVYQRYAPYHIRSECMFVPNCSEYMVLAIEKYGLISGIKRGIDRLNRCHPPNGGEDYP